MRVQKPNRDGCQSLFTPFFKVHKEKLTLNTWKASNWMLRDFSLSMIIMSLRLSGLLM
jgi:hypothetical protein